MTVEEAPPSEAVLLQTVESARDRVSEAREALIAAESELQGALAAAFAGGVKGPAIARLLGVTVSRVYQLRRGR
jgi:hypothetical protein